MIFSFWVALVTFHLRVSWVGAHDARRAYFMSPGVASDRWSQALPFGGL
jgi:hypothetical protein